ncbi:hypothetical protein [Sphingomonas endolithica]|uniref:hypothetical protein n=1 Tax=Sphingomonas endolithica TaxID=2972485 RepID=UPI0021AFDB5C|nr:hypothetical protein [Sphingomonas sp. ZFBP2030]
MSDSIPTPSTPRDILAEILTGAAGSKAAKWRKAVGEVEKLSLAFNIRTNWAIHPTGSPADLAAIDKAAEVVRAAHPYVAG